MFSREQMNLARPVGQLFLTFSTLIFSVLLLTTLSYTSTLTYQMMTSFSQEILQQGMGNHYFQYFFSLSLPAPQMELASLLWRRWEQWNSGLCFQSVMKENDGNRCARAIFFHHTSQRLHKLELFDRVLCWDWVVDSLGTGSAFTSSCKILSSVYWKMLS